MTEESSRNAVETERERILHGLDSLPLYRIYAAGDGRWGHLRADVKDLVAGRPTETPCSCNPVRQPGLPAHAHQPGCPLRSTETPCPRGCTDTCLEDATGRVYANCAKRPTETPCRACGNPSGACDVPGACG